ncbi:hypothetical protein FF38_06527 [Lucilia cuprina]|uniref:Uncharacterized protein n=1 Tax=Lucilia cuprina TaxID=7375 RepID=A0A0L0C5B0_LUCCU|nr:hypothetical protein FF38_06527 [Lucilia cuprina]
MITLTIRNEILREIIEAQSLKETSSQNPANKDNNAKGTNDEEQVGLVNIECKSKRSFEKRGRRCLALKKDAGNKAGKIPIKPVSMETSGEKSPNIGFNRHGECFAEKYISCHIHKERVYNPANKGNNVKAYISKWNGSAKSTSKEVLKNGEVWLTL